MLRVTGMDPSLTGFAVARWDAPTDQPVVSLFSSRPSLGGVAGRIARYRGLVVPAVNLVEPESLVVIESYGFAASGNAGCWLAELGGLLRDALVTRGHDVVEATSNQLKKFATGTGKGDKGFVQAHVSRRWGVIFKTNDETDAYVLARIGACYLDESRCETAWQREVIHNMKYPVIKKTKKRKGIEA